MRVRRVTAGLLGALLAAGCAAGPVPAPPGRGGTQIVDIFGPRCGELPSDGAGSAQEMAQAPAATALAALPLTAMFGELLDTAGTLDELPAATVYAPSDGALTAYRQRIGEAEWSALVADRGRLEALLRQHVSDARATAAQLVAAGTSRQLAGPAIAIGGTPLRMTLTGLDGAVVPVLCGNIPTRNATVFVIDGVLAP